MFQDIGHGFISFSLSVCMRYVFLFLSLFGLKTCFIFHLFLCILRSIIIYTLNKAAALRTSILYNKGTLIRIKDDEFTI